MVCLLVLQPFAPSCFHDFLTNTASADFSQTLAQEISPGKVLKLSARAAKLYLMRLSVMVGFRVSLHTYRPHPASLLVRVPTVVLLLRASFSLTSRLPPCVSLRLPLLTPVITFQITSFSPCRAHNDAPPCVGTSYRRFPKMYE
jgi:hypothetical protein